MIAPTPFFMPKNANEIPMTHISARRCSRRCTTIVVKIPTKMIFTNSMKRGYRKASVPTAMKRPMKVQMGMNTISPVLKFQIGFVRSRWKNHPLTIATARNMDQRCPFANPHARS
ncbi:hypothetical protein N9L90_00615 [Planctomycetota bacterium]|nr:hypothetical protein [Planctomycetota bacterium]